MLPEAVVALLEDAVDLLEDAVAWMVAVRRSPWGRQVRQGRLAVVDALVALARPDVDFVPSARLAVMADLAARQGFAERVAAENQKVAVSRKGHRRAGPPDLHYQVSRNKHQSSASGVRTCHQSAAVLLVPQTADFSTSPLRPNLN